MENSEMLPLFCVNLDRKYNLRYTGNIATQHSLNKLQHYYKLKKQDKGRRTYP